MARFRRVCCSVVTTLLLSFLRGNVGIVDGYSSKSVEVPSRSKLLADLQSCHTAHQVLDRVGRHVTPTNDVDGTLASLVWVRLNKQLIHEDNQNMMVVKQRTKQSSLDGFEDTASTILSSLTTHLLDLRRHDEDNKPTAALHNAALELTKAACVISRLGITSSIISSHVYEPIADFWSKQANNEIGQQQSSPATTPLLQPHQLSGLKWSYDCFSLNHPSLFCNLPKVYEEAYNQLQLPFCMIPGGIVHDSLTVERLAQQVDFRVDEIRTLSNQVVSERRHTAWQGDDGIPDFVYSSKSMPRQNWSPLVQDVRHLLFTATTQYYDCCLLNLYPNGDSGMRYHADPDQGTLWDYDTAVVSVGAARRVAFRATTTTPTFSSPPSNRHHTPHTFHVLHGDVMHMFGDCQERFQHTVKKAECKGDDSPRSSLVFKRTWSDESPTIIGK